MTGVLSVETYGPDDYFIRIARPPGLGHFHFHSIDVGPTDASQATHTTRDGLPMTVFYKRELGYAVAVHTP